MITGWRRFSERLGGGASIFQDLDLGEALSAEAKLRPTEEGGKHPPEAKSFGKSSAEDLKRREMLPPPVTSYLFLGLALAGPLGRGVPQSLRALDTRFRAEGVIPRGLSDLPA